MSAESLSSPLMAASDPFYAVRDAVDGEVKQLRVRFDRWQALLQSSNTADMPFQIAHEECGKDLRKTQEMVRKVKAAVTAVERNRVKYPHIDDRELASRKSFIGNLESIVNGLIATYDGPETQGRITADRKRELTVRQATETAAVAQRESRYGRANDGFVGDHQQQQQQIRQGQDAILVKMDTGLTRLDEMAREMRTEIDAQAVIIEDVDRDVDVAQSKMDHAMKGIQKLLKTKDTCQLATIAGLVLVFIIVAVVAFT